MIIPSNYIEHLKDFVNTEQDLQNHEQLEVWRKPLEIRVSEAMAIDGLRVETYSDNQAILQFTRNRSKFREGDPLRLNRGNPSNQFIKCELVEELDDNRLRIKPGFREFFQNLEPRDGWVLDMDAPDLRQIQLSALEEINFNKTYKRYFNDLLNGHQEQHFRQFDNKQGVPVPQELLSNTKQSEAFFRAFLAENFYLIQGPPGTGKTRVLAHLAESFARERKNVLITAFTHRAINNALKAVAKNTKYRNVFKVGQYIHSTDLIFEGGKIPNFENFSDSGFDPETKGLIVGGTCYATRGKRLQNVGFDVVIFDEAGQMTLPLAMIGMMRAPKAIFIGDHKQMPPVITGKHELDWVRRSIFELLFQHYPGTMLDITYRMNNRISEFPSKKFYGGLLHPNESTKNNRLKIAQPSEQWREILSPEHPDVFIQVNHRNRTLDSIEEATIVAQLVFESLSCGISPKDLAVVAPYRAQGRLIKNELRMRLNSPKLFREIVVDTVERIQGQEREMIIISLTTSDPSHAAQNAEFYFHPNRLNVAITRPKTKRIIIGSTYLFAAVPNEKEHREWVNNFRELYKQCKIIEVMA